MACDQRDLIWLFDLDFAKTSKDNWESLTNRMKDHAESYISPSHMEYSFLFDPIDVEKIIPTVRQQVYLIFKEAIANVLKHSTGDEINISLTVNKKQLTMHIHDNGDAAEIKTSGIGMTSMKRRAEQINGQILIDQNEGFKLCLIC